MELTILAKVSHSFGVAAAKSLLLYFDLVSSYIWIVCVLGGGGVAKGLCMCCNNVIFLGIGEHMWVCCERG